ALVSASHAQVSPRSERRLEGEAARGHRSLAAADRSLQDPGKAPPPLEGGPSVATVEAGAPKTAHVQKRRVVVPGGPVRRALGGRLYARSDRAAGTGRRDRDWHRERRRRGRARAEARRGGGRRDVAARDGRRGGKRAGCGAGGRRRPE